MGRPRVRARDRCVAHVRLGQPHAGTGDEPSAARDGHVRAQLPDRFRSRRRPLHRCVLRQSEVGRSEPSPRARPASIRRAARSDWMTVPTAPLPAGVAASDASATGSAELVPCTLSELTLYFLRLGTLGFGGPIALAGYMQRDLVERRRWLSKQDYVEGLALAQLAPGPLAAQLAIYLGWVRGGVLGGTLVGLAFVLPSFLMVLVISALYVRFGGLPWMRGAFYGIGAAVIAIIVRSVVKLTKLTLAKDWLLWTLFAASGIATAWTESEIV